MGMAMATVGAGMVMATGVATVAMATAGAMGMVAMGTLELALSTGVRAALL